MSSKTRPLINIAILFVIILSQTTIDSGHPPSFFLETTNTITGHVTAPDRSGIEGVTICAFLLYKVVYLPLVSMPGGNSSSIPQQENSCFGYSTMTDASGNYTLSGLPAGEYFVKAQKDGIAFTPALYDITVPGGNNLNFKVDIPASVISIQAGSFQMGCDPAHNDGYPCYSSALLHTITLDAYRIDKYEVTNAQYAQCVAAGGCAAPRSIASNDRESYYNDPFYANYPVITVYWQDAYNYCAWAGKRLPTEAEWEKAARGTILIAYPWGDASPTCSLVNGSISGEYCVGDTSAVGHYPAGASPYGVMDMSGNVEEWVNDWYDKNYYSVSPSNNPQGPSSGTYRVIRGGSWWDYEYQLRVALRGYSYPNNSNFSIGFRCAASP